MTGAGLALCAVASVVVACSSPTQPKGETTRKENVRGPGDAVGTNNVSATAPSGAAQAIDELFAQYAKQLPEPATLSQQNGATCECEHHGGATYTLLYAASEKVPTATDADLVHVIKWARHQDPCIRQIAIDVLVAKLGYDRNSLSLPNMHDTAHYQFHAIHAALRARLDSQRIAYEEAEFGGLLFVTDTKQAVRLLAGSWIEEVDANAGRQFLLEVTPQSSRLTSRHLPIDAKFPDSEYIAPLEGLSLVDGHVMAKADPNHQFWLVTNDLVWFRALSPYWVKLRRVTR